MSQTVMHDGTLVEADHFLKTWPDVFQQILDGAKRHEFRHNDRGFASGDAVLLQEWDPDRERYTGRYVLVKIRAISYGPEWGIPVGYASFTIEPVEGVVCTWFTGPSWD